MSICVINEKIWRISFMSVSDVLCRCRLNTNTMLSVRITSE
jgi:hypothetical protein